MPMDMQMNTAAFTLPSSGVASRNAQVWAG
jgi:hypothetical protein